MFLFFSLILIFSTHLREIKSDLISALPNLNYSQILHLIQESEKLPNSACVSQFLVLAAALSKQEEWAIKMVDASAKPQSGILMGNLFHVGNYDECLEIEKRGKYCTTVVTPHPDFGKDLSNWLSQLLKDFAQEGSKNLAEEARLSYGFCVPKICTVQDLQNLANSLEYVNKFPLHFQFDEVFCDGGDPRPFTTPAICAVVIFSAFALILLVSTLYEIFFHKHAEARPNFLFSFSVLANGKKLLATRPSQDDLNCLNGLRVISMMWVVLDHEFQHKFYEPHTNTVTVIQEWLNAKENSFFMSGAFAVDSFFTIGGLLVVYIFMKNRSRGVKFSLPMFYLHRILRLTPALAMTIFFTSTLLVHMGDGPFWPIVETSFQKYCEDSWWATLLYIQNYKVAATEQCVWQAWYLAVDTQMYFLSPLILFPLLKWPKRTISVLLLLVVSSCSYVFAITWIKRYGTTFFDENEYPWEVIYYPTHVRGSVYLIGMICGYYVHTMKTSRPLKLTKIQVIALWTSSLGVMVGVCFAQWAVISATTYNVVYAALFNSLTRVAWSMALCVIILLCINGHGGIINSFLSLKIFTVLIRVNYSLYLVHQAVMIITLAQGRIPSHFSNLYTLHQFWGDYIFSLGVAFLWTLAFESPVLVIEKFVFENKKRKQAEAEEQTIDRP